MSRIEPLSRDDASDEIRAIYDEIQGAFGMIPNLFKTYAHFPALLKANWEKTKTLMIGGELPRPLKEMIAIVVSRANSCNYCVAAHGMMLQQLGFSKDHVKALEEDIDRADVSERDRAILAFAEKSTTAPLSITEDDVARLKGYGLTDAELVEAQGVMELFTGYNKFIDSLAVDLDFKEEAMTE